MQSILDPCCGSRMMWFDKQDQRCLFGDLRTESHYLKDRGNLRHLEIHPDVRLDFTALPFADDSFNLVVFDPPHLVRAGKKIMVGQKIRSAYSRLARRPKQRLRRMFPRAQTRWRAVF